MKIIIHWVLNAAAIAVAAYLLPGVHVVGAMTAFIVAVVLGAINTFLRPVLMILTLPFSIMTLGLFILILNAALILLAAKLVPGFSIDSFWWALAFGLVLWVVHATFKVFERD